VDRVQSSPGYQAASYQKFCKVTASIDEASSLADEELTHGPADRHAGYKGTVRPRSLQPVRPDQLERRLRERLDALGPAPGAELLHVLMLPDLERADRIGEFWSYPQSRAFAELLIDCDKDRTLRAVLVGMLREAEH
jgi:hypothetical protein